MYTHCSIYQPSTPVYLDLEDLDNFTFVTNQFQAWGVTFKNALAIEPSNYAYPPHSGKLVLIAAPRDGWLEINFQTPIRFFQCYVTCFGQVIISAYDRNRRLIATNETSGGNLAGFNSSIAPNTPLDLKISNNNPFIERITIGAFGHQFTVDDLSFA